MRPGVVNGEWHVGRAVRSWPRPLTALAAAVIALALLVGSIGAAAAPAHTSPTFDPRAVIEAGEVVGWHGVAGCDGSVTITYDVCTTRAGPTGAPVEERHTLVNTYTTPGSTVWVVPTGVTSIVFDVKGAGGGSGAGNNAAGERGGNGGRAQGTLAVSGSQSVTIDVGGGGGGGTYFNGIGTGSGGAGGTNGGGAGGYAQRTAGTGGNRGGGGGGGSSHLAVNGTSIALAGGGGGGTVGLSGGDGGGSTATAGDSSGTNGGVSAGGGAGANGVGGTAGGTGSGFVAATAGTNTTGGAGGSISTGLGGTSSYGGGGGGGGWGGGGGGSAGADFSSVSDVFNGAGGGGDGYLDGSVTSGTLTQGGGGAGGAAVAGNTSPGNAGTNGSVSITYNGRPTQPGAITGVVGGGAYPVGSALSIGWGASTDPEGDPFTYSLWYRLNGGSAVLIASGIATNAYSWTPTQAGSWVLEVAGVDAGGAGDVRQSGTFTTFASGPRMIVG